MANKILFSPVGGTDPISMNNMYDGSLLHICRYYKPDIVYLYMSKEVLNNHHKDNRYIFCLDKLAEKLGIKMKYIIIERDNLENVQRFDYIYNDILNIIGDIASHMNLEDELYLNVSSGTPAMKSALLVINVLGEYSFKAIQVSTPMRKMNEHSHSGYDVKTLWELNVDNEIEENRCEEIDCPALIKQKKKEIIKKHIMEFDYDAALNVAITIDDENNDYIKMIKLGKCRLALDFKNADAIDRNFNKSFFPIKSGDERKYFEYTLSLIVKQRKGQYADFIRALTPIIVDLFNLILDRENKVKIEDLTTIDKKTKGQKWDEKKLRNLRPDINKILLNEYNDFKYSFVLSDHLKTIIVSLNSVNVKMIDMIKKIRNIEVSIRNMAAHQIISIDDSVIKNKTGFSSDEIIKLLIDIFKYTKLNIKKVYWNSYDEMNDRIIKSIG